MSTLLADPSRKQVPKKESAARRILVVDDYEPWRYLVSSLLQEHTGVRVVGEAADGLEALKRTAELKPDLVLLDIHLPKLNGIEVANRIGHASPGTKILFMSQSNDADVVRGFERQSIRLRFENRRGNRAFACNRSRPSGREGC